MKAALRILIFVIVMGSLAGALLVGIDIFTKPLIDKNKELKLKSAVLDALEIPYGKNDALMIFKDKVEARPVDKFIFYRSADGSIAFEFAGPGLWGPILGIASINSDLKTIKKIKILHQEETPGLGARIAELDFLKQFRGKEFSPRLVFRPQGKSSAKNEVDAITGATGSSRALEKLLNDTLQKNIGILGNERG